MSEVLCFFVRERGCGFVVPMVVGKTWPPVGRPQEGLEGTGQVHEQVTHQEKPKTDRIRADAHEGESNT